MEWNVEAKRIVSFVENFMPPEMIYRLVRYRAYLVVDKRAILVDNEYCKMHYNILIII